MSGREGWDDVLDYFLIVERCLWEFYVIFSADLSVALKGNEGNAFFALSFDQGFWGFLFKFALITNHYDAIESKV